MNTVPDLWTIYPKPGRIRNLATMEFSVWFLLRVSRILTFGSLLLWVNDFLQVFSRNLSKFAGFNYLENLDFLWRLAAHVF